ncbi:L-histidine N(alpha)-methyltransferase [Chelatococcus reniformis]|uniref:Dimethylhistidine N-methyltransferase n=1 Tax=Chelatococcus reniformis TaxID=1494448 RepID=A0A916XK15_9HYPH|nr:L-histidine N(alpha)-methyltransferase [Chelatococcus reniformis]GGC76249.1 dimethylhistidine N-methyltransferase [Chelatococcus reniformis]
MHDLSASLSHSDHDLFRADVVEGLSHIQKAIPCRWLYDERGSDLFEEITRLDDYYPTRTETEILRTRQRALREYAGPGPILIEYGAGAGVKTELVLEALESPRGYVPIDVAREYLLQTARRMESRAISLWVRPVERDFLSAFEMPAGMPAGRRVGFFPGSTIGNLDADDAEAFLSQMARHVGPDGAAFVGVDLVKPVERLLRAYDDSEGVTALFNLNLLARINKELAGDFHLDRFRHVARWNDAEKAVEMHLLSLAEQWVSIGQRRFHFRSGETIHTESSRKYDREGFAALAMRAGWRVSQAWEDDERLFCVFALSPRVTNLHADMTPRGVVANTISRERVDAAHGPR